MASASRRSRRRPTTATAIPETAAKRQPVPAAAPLTDSIVGNSQSFHLGTKGWACVYLGIFAALMVILGAFFFGIGGDDRVRREMLVEAESFEEAGNHQAVLELYEEYAKRWPGAVGTPNFELRLGRVNANLGRYEEAAHHFERSVAANPKAWDTRALAGEASWKAGKKERAIELFAEELSAGNPESDLANYYIGLYALEQGNVAQALRHLQAIREPARYEAELAAARARIEEDILKPSREAALLKAKSQ